MAERAPWDAEIHGLLAGARASDDEPLRRLLASYIALRRSSAEMLTLIEAREGAAAVVRTPLFRRASLGARLCDAGIPRLRRPGGSGARQDRAQWLCTDAVAALHFASSAAASVGDTGFVRAAGR